MRVSRKSASSSTINTLHPLSKDASDGTGWGCGSMVALLKGVQVFGIDKSNACAMGRRWAAAFA
jgi:hypothetical protein